MGLNITRHWNEVIRHPFERTYTDVPAGWPLRRELWDAGESVAGRLRIQVGRTRIGRDTTVYDWPISESPEQYLIAEGETASFAVHEPDAVEALRTLRERAIADATVAPGLFIGFIPVEVPGEVLDRNASYVVSLRDELPFSDSEGKWSPP